MNKANGLPPSPRRRQMPALPRAERRSGPRQAAASPAARHGRRGATLGGLLGAGLVAFLAAGSAQANGPAPPPWARTPSIPAITDAAVAPAGSPRATCLDALRRTEQRHRLPPGLLVAIGLNESGLHAHAINIGGRAHFPDSRAEAERMLRGARSGYVMAGCLQINAGVHARGAVWPLDPNAAGEWAAGFLRTHYERTGDWAEVLRRWHGASPGRAGTYLCRVRGKLEVVQPDSPIFAGLRCAPTVMARLRRNGAAHLEVAEAR